MTTEPLEGIYPEGSTGHQGDASRDAEKFRRAGLNDCLERVRRMGYYGLTVKEYRERTGDHHGSASSRLSNLHALGKIAKLKERRNHCGIYVVPDAVGDRQTVPRRRNPREVEVPVEVVREVEVPVEVVRGVTVTRREVMEVIRGWQDRKMSGAAFGVESLADAIVALVATKGKELT